MADDAELQERQQLIAAINRTIAAIEHEQHRQIQLLAELEFLTEAIVVLTAAAAEMGYHVDSDLAGLAERVRLQESNASALLAMLADLSERYFAYKNLSTATKNITQFTDEYYTRFSYYAELRRVTLGYVIGLDTHIISSETARKKVEKAYLQNSEYWLTYCITATMLWASEEREAAQRAVSKALSLDPAKSSLYFLLTNLRFNRLDAAVKWYEYYLDRVDAAKLGDDWQYLLQAHLSGSFGASQQLEAHAQARFQDMMAQVQVTNIAYPSDVAARAMAYAKSKPHATTYEFGLLGQCSKDFEQMRSLLSTAEHNALLAEEFARIAAEEPPEGSDLAETIEDTLYHLVESMDVEEAKIYQRIKYNEFIVAAKGDLSMAQTAYDERYPASAESNFGDLLLRWAFSDGDVRVSPLIRRFSISFVKEWIEAGFNRFAEEYRRQEKERYQIYLGDWAFECSEDEADLAVEKFEDHFGKTKWKDFLKDKYILIWGGMVAAALLIILGMILGRTYASWAIVTSVLLGICGGFLLWRRIVDLDAILLDAKRVKVETIRKLVAEIGDWRKAYKAADSAFAEVQQSLALFD